MMPSSDVPDHHLGQVAIADARDGGALVPSRAGTRAARELPALTTRLQVIRCLGWFCLANAVLFALISLSYRHAIEPPVTMPAQLYRLLSELVHWPFLAGLLIGVPLAPMALLPGRALPARLLAAACVATAAGSLMMLNAVVYANYRMHLGGYVWGLLLGGAAGEIFVLSGWMWTLIGMILTVGLLLEAALFAWCWTAAVRPSRFRPGLKLAALWALAFVVLNGVHAWADATYETTITREDNHLPWFEPLTAKSFLEDIGFVAPEAAQLPSFGGFRGGEDMRYPLQPMTCRPAERPLNLLVILVESWRHDLLNQAVTPHVAALAHDSTVFQQHLSGGNCTRYGVFTLFYGLPGNYWDTAVNSRTPPVLVERLLEQGYEPAIFGSAPLTSPEFDRSVFAGIPNLRLQTPGQDSGARDRRIADDMLAFLRARRPGDQPFFGFLFFDTPHSLRYPPDAPEPFQPSGTWVNYLALDPDFDATKFFNRYRNAVHFADAEIGRVLDMLRELELMDDTVVMITSDHGEEFNDTGKNYWGHNGNFSKWQLQVPMVLHWPGRQPAQVPALTSHYDVAPTLLQNLLGCTDPPANYGLGVSMLGAQRPSDYIPAFSYTQMGIYQPERITALPLGGLPRVYGPDYDELDEKPEPAVLRNVMRDMSRFLRHASR